MKFIVYFSFLTSLLFTDPNTTGINYSNGMGVGRLYNCNQSIRLNSQKNSLLLLLLEPP